MVGFHIIVARQLRDNFMKSKPAFLQATSVKVTCARTYSTFSKKVGSYMQGFTAQFVLFSVCFEWACEVF